MSRKAKEGPAAERHRPPPLAIVLKDRRPSERSHYVILREALLALAGVTEVVEREGEDWVPTFRAGSVEFLRARFTPGGQRSGRLRLEFEAPATVLAALSEDPSLSATTRRRLRSAMESSGPCTLAVGREDSLVECVGLAVMLAARVGG